MKAPFILLYATVFLTLSAFTYRNDTATTVDFEATYTTTKEVLEPPPMLKQRITGLGKSNVLAISKFVAVSTQQVVQPAPFKLSGPTTFYADNGDVFYANFTGTSTPNADGTISIEIVNTITGGTGKFDHASGSLTGKSVVDPKKPSASIIVKGSITY